MECMCIDFANPAFITLLTYGTSLPNTAGTHMIRVWPIWAFRFPSHSDLFNDQHVVQAWLVTAYANSFLGICFGPALTSRGEAAWEWSQYRRRQNWELEKALPSFGGGIWPPISMCTQSLSLDFSVIWAGYSLLFKQNKTKKPRFLLFASETKWQLN